MMAGFLALPLLVMIIPSITYWRDFKKEKHQGNPGKKARYRKVFFFLLVTGVLCMWVFWIGGILTFLSGFNVSFLRTVPITLSSQDGIQIAGLVFFYLGAFIYNFNILVAGKYLRPAPAGTLEKQQLIRKGPFALIRHPLYVSYILILAGLSGILLSFWILIPTAFVIVGIYPTAKAEEEVLIEQLGDRYLTYRNEVGMFFPKLCSKSR